MQISYQLHPVNSCLSPTGISSSNWRHQVVYRQDLSLSGPTFIQLTTPTALDCWPFRKNGQLINQSEFLEGRTRSKNCSNALYGMSCVVCVYCKLIHLKMLWRNSWIKCDPLNFNATVTKTTIRNTMNPSLLFFLPLHSDLSSIHWTLGSPLSSSKR